MKGLLKNLGLILILAGVVILLGCSFTGNVNNNAILRYFSSTCSTGTHFLYCY